MTGIELENGVRTPGYPVIKRQRIGETTVLSIIRFEIRPTKKSVNGQLVEEKWPDGNPKLEAVIHGFVLPGTDAEAGIGGESSVPAPGSRVRMIFAKRGYKEWKDARKAHRGGKLQVGDILFHVVTHAQAYDHTGAPHGQKITDQSAANAVPRGQTLGYYGTVELQVPSTQDQWHGWGVASAEAAYRSDTAINLEDAQEYTEPAEAQAFAAAPPWASPTPVAAQAFAAAPPWASPAPVAAAPIAAAPVAAPVAAPPAAPPAPVAAPPLPS